MVNVDGSKRIWKQPEIKDIFEKCGAKKPDKATWGDVQDYLGEKINWKDLT